MEELYIYNDAWINRISIYFLSNIKCQVPFILDVFCFFGVSFKSIFLSITGKASSFEEEDGTGTGRSEIRVQLGRGDLGNRLTCRSENEALPANQPLQKSVQVDINCKFNCKIHKQREYSNSSSLLS